MAQEQQERQPEDHEEAADVVPQRAAGQQERAHAQRGVDEEEHDQGPAGVDRVHAGQSESHERQDEKGQELRRLADVRARFGEGPRQHEPGDHGRREGGGEEDIAPPGLRPRDDVGQHEGRSDDEPHGVGEDADRDRQGRPQRMTPGEERESAHRERERHQEGVLAVRLVERHDEREPPGGPDVVDLPQVAQVEVEGDGDRARGDDDDEPAGDVLRQQVVDEAVRDGAVAASVPVRVPEDGVAAAQQEHLVGVGGVVPAGDAAPLHEQRDQRHGGGRRQPQSQQAATRPQPVLERGEGHAGGSSGADLGGRARAASGGLTRAEPPAASRR